MQAASVREKCQQLIAKQDITAPAHTSVILLFPQNRHLLIPAAFLGICLLLVDYAKGIFINFPYKGTLGVDLGPKQLSGS